VSLEATGYDGPGDRRRSRLLDGWGPHKARALGADAAKLLVYFHPDRGEEASHQLSLIGEAAAACAEADIPLLLEAVSYAIDGVAKDSAAFAAQRPRIVMESARQITALPIDILKAEFPADLQHEQDEGRLLDCCRQLSEASRMPWVVLSAGVNYEAFRRQVELACRGGASGFLAGRAIWQEAFDLAPAERERFLKTTAADRVRELRETAVRHATPWQRLSRGRYPSLESLSEDWYRTYGASG
jgi:tagatose 1,6-diphosphate aldolase